MRNNNKAVIRTLTKQSLRANHARNQYLFAAIALTTFMLASVLSIGLSFNETMARQALRLSGGPAEAVVHDLTPQGLEALRALPLVKSAGAAYAAGSVVNEWDDTLLRLAYCDETLWNDFWLPAYSSVAGRYPQSADEIMLPRGVLQWLGIEEPSLGMAIELSLPQAQGYKATAFTLSGYYTTHGAGLPGQALWLPVSETYWQAHGNADAGITASLVFANPTDPAKNKEDLKNALTEPTFAHAYAEFPIPYANANPFAAVPVITAISVFLMFTGFLLIYNVLTISVANDVRFYGLLKTIGTTPRQLRALVTGQALRLCLAAIPLGAAAAALMSLVLVPLALSGYDADTAVSFSPFIFIGAMVFSLLTALAGAALPARKAARVSPVEAARFAGDITNKKRTQLSGGVKPHRMALRNLFRDKRRAAVVFLSLFLGFAVFITVTTVTNSLDAEKYAQSFGVDDFLLRNHTSRVTVPGEVPPPPVWVNGELYKTAIQDMPGVTSLWTTERVFKNLPYTAAYDAFLADMLSRTTFSDDAYADMLVGHMKERFEAMLLGVAKADLEQLNPRLPKPLDVNAFERGEFVLIAASRPALFDGITEIEVTLGGVPMRLPVAGIAPGDYKGADNNSLNIIISKQFLMQCGENLELFSIGLNVEEAYQQQTLSALERLTAGDAEVYLSSRVALKNEVRNAKLVFGVIGGSLAGILGLIGALNFVNVISVGILSRKRELAALESVGMTRKQIRAMLVLEGVGYAAFTLLLALTLGNVAAVFAYNVLATDGWSVNVLTFAYPLLPVLITSAAIVAICLLVPALVYKASVKATLAERLREAG